MNPPDPPSSGVPVSRTVADRITLFLGEGFGLGRIPVAPGTFGSLLGIPLGWLIWQGELDWPQRLAIWGVLFLPGIAICHRSAELRAKKDPGSVVWDEITAFPLVYLLVTLNWTMLLAGFVAFRFFDIVKPWPVKRFEKLPGGLGIMADDQIAAVFAAFVLLALEWATGRQ